MFKIHAIAFIGLAAILGSSCRKNEDAIRTVSFPATRVFSQTYPNSDGETPVIYKIFCDAEPPTVRFAVFGDGAHVVMGSSVDVAGRIILKMEDQRSEEEWSLSINPFEQVIVQPDRSVQSVSDFVRFENNGLVFGETENPLLTAVANAYNRNAQNKNR